MFCMTFTVQIQPKTFFARSFRLLRLPPCKHQLDPTDQESAFKDLDHEVETVDVSVRGVEYLEIEWNLVFFLQY